MQDGLLGHLHLTPDRGCSLFQSTTPSMSFQTLAIHLCSPPADPLEDDDLLSEILLRLPPLPSSLPRAAAVSRRWRSLASDPRFSLRFRVHHRREPPLLGFFISGCQNVRFQPFLDSPNRVPQDRFPFPIAAGDGFRILGCRHGLMLIILHSSRKQILVWDPVTGDQHLLDIPPELDMVKYPISGAVLRAAGDVHHFQVVLVRNSDMQHAQPVASLYSSKTGMWGNLATAAVQPGDSSGFGPAWVYISMPAVMVGNSLYWLVAGNSVGILEFDLNRQSLALLPVPLDRTLTSGMDLGKILPIVAEGGGLGFFFLSKFSAQLWKTKTNFDGVTSWVLDRTIALDKLFSIDSEERECPFIMGFAEDNNVVVLRTSIGIFTVQLESLQFKKNFETTDWYRRNLYPFEVVYTAGKGIGSGDVELNFCKMHNMISSDRHAMVMY